MWISWWTKLNLSRFFSGFLPFSPTTNFSTLISFISFHPLLWCVSSGRPESLLFTDLQYSGFITSHSSTWPCVGHSLGDFWQLSFLQLFSSVSGFGHTCGVVVSMFIRLITIRKCLGYDSQLYPRSFSGNIGQVRGPPSFLTICSHLICEVTKSG